MPILKNTEITSGTGRRYWIDADGKSERIEEQDVAVLKPVFDRQDADLLTDLLQALHSRLLLIAAAADVYDHDGWSVAMLKARIVDQAIPPILDSANFAIKASK